MKRRRWNPVALHAGDVGEGVRVSAVRAPSWTRHRVRDSADAVVAVRRIIPSDDEREFFVALYLDTKNALKAWSIVSIGTLSASLVHPREVFRPAIVVGAFALVVGHNHPSGDASPSREDLEVTERLKEAGKWIGIELLDHVVIGAGKEHTSLRERGHIA